MKTAKPPAAPAAPVDPPPPPDVGRSLLDLLGKAQARDLAALDDRIGELEKELAAVREVRKLVAARLGLTPERKKPGPAANGHRNGTHAPAPARAKDPARPNGPVRRGLVGAAEKTIAAFLATAGPKSQPDIVAGCGVQGAHAGSALRCDWFTVLPDGRYSITPLGRQEALDD